MQRLADILQRPLHADVPLSECQNALLACHPCIQVCSLADAWSSEDDEGRVRLKEQLQCLQQQAQGLAPLTTMTLNCGLVSGRSM